jgi:hypothetical protein
MPSNSLRRLRTRDAHQRGVLARREVQIFVTGDQVAERLRREQHLEGVERAPLVDVGQPTLEHRLALHHVVLRQRHFGGGALQFGSEPADLPLDLLHQRAGGLALALQVAELRVDIDHLSLQSLLLLLQLIALASDLFQALA